LIYFSLPYSESDYMAGKQMQKEVID